MSEVLSEALEHKRVVDEVRAAELVGLSVVHLRRLRQQGKGPRYVRLGSRRLGYRLGAVFQWIDARLSDVAG
jgi:predicted DNA-binding transcriptional regulator AlpA